MKYDYLRTKSELLTDIVEKLSHNEGFYLPAEICIEHFSGLFKKNRSEPFKFNFKGTISARPTGDGRYYFYNLYGRDDFPWHKLNIFSGRSEWKAVDYGGIFAIEQVERRMFRETIITIYPLIQII